jgi:Regulatory subunit of type II PKA R-subunit
MSKQKVKVPDSLRDVLLEFSIAYLLEQPGDVIDFAVDFFTKLQSNRAQTGIGIGITKPTTPDESIISQDDGECALNIRSASKFHANRMQILWSLWLSETSFLTSFPCLCHLFLQNLRFTHLR